MMEHFLTQTGQILIKEPGTNWGDTDTWKISQEVNTYIRLLSGGEQYAQGTRKEITTHRAYVFEPLSYENRFQCEGSVYRIELIDPQIGNRFYQIDLRYLSNESEVTQWVTP